MIMLFAALSFSAEMRGEDIPNFDAQ